MQAPTLQSIEGNLHSRSGFNGLSARTGRGSKLRQSSRNFFMALNLVQYAPIFGLPVELISYIFVLLHASFFTPNEWTMDWMEILWV